jgi:hypothetical protein
MGVDRSDTIGTRLVSLEADDKLLDVLELHDDRPRERRRGGLRYRPEQLRPKRTKPTACRVCVTRSSFIRTSRAPSWKEQASNTPTGRCSTVTACSSKLRPTDTSASLDIVSFVPERILSFESRSKAQTSLNHTP